MNGSHLALAGAAALVIALGACSSAAPPEATSTIRPASPSSPAVSPAILTIGPSIPAEGPFGAWWNRASGNGTLDGGLAAQDNLANDLGYLAQGESSGDDAALSSDGARLVTDMTLLPETPNSRRLTPCLRVGGVRCSRTM